MEIEAERKAQSQKETDKEPHRKTREYSVRANRDRYRNKDGEKEGKDAEVPEEVKTDQATEPSAEQEQHGEYSESAETSEAWGYENRDRFVIT
jgi:hypothetical protein